MKLSVPLFLVAAALALPAAAQSFRDFGMWDPWANLQLPESPDPTLTQPAPTEPTTPPPTDSFLAGGVSPIPEPTTSALVLAGLGVVGLLYRRRSKK